MNIRRFQPGEEFALFEVFYSAIHLIARNDYSEEQLNAWAPLDFDCELWVDRFGFVVVDRKKTIIRGVELRNALMRKELRDIA